MSDRCSICSSKSHGTQAHQAADIVTERIEKRVSTAQAAEPQPSNLCECLTYWESHHPECPTLNTEHVGKDGRSHFRVTGGNCACGWTIINEFEWTQHLKQETAEPPTDSGWISNRVPADLRVAQPAEVEGMIVKPSTIRALLSESQLADGALREVTAEMVSAAIRDHGHVEGRTERVFLIRDHINRALRALAAETQGEK